MKEGWVLKNCCFWTVELEMTLESPLDCKDLRPINPKGNQPWIFIGRTDAEAEAPILWPPDVKSQLIGKDPDAGKDRRQEKGMTEDKMVGWYHWLSGHEFEQAPGGGEGQGILCAVSMGSLRHDWATEQQNLKGREFSYVHWPHLGLHSLLLVLLNSFIEVSSICLKIHF